VLDLKESSKENFVGDCSMVTFVADGSQWVFFWFFF
jgi:hypothetical protein